MVNFEKNSPPEPALSLTPEGEFRLHFTTLANFFTNSTPYS